MIHWFDALMSHCFIAFASLIHWFTVRRLTTLLTHSFTIDLLIHCVVASLFTDSLIGWLADWWIMDEWVDGWMDRWILVSLIHWFTGSSIQWLIHGFIGSLIHSICCAWIISCPVIGTTTAICSFVDALQNFNDSLLLHLKSLPIGHLLPIVMSCVRNFRPGACRALPGSFRFV